MTLLYNVYLDDKVRIPGFYFRGLYGEKTNSIDIFKYALHSVVNIYDWKKVIINFELCESYKNKEHELLDYIKLLFKDFKCIISSSRCKYQSDWRKLYDQLDEDIIYFCCNHDHIFVDNDVKHFKECVEEFKNQFSDEHASLYFSHWQESNVLFSKSNCTLKNTYFHLTSNSVDSVQIITKKTYHHWWFSMEFPNKMFPRTDYFNGFIPTQYEKHQAVPYREFFRHFDGYSHLSNFTFQMKMLSTNICPPLFIPQGFFNNNIKLRIGFDENHNDCININLKKPNYTVIDKSGTDLKCFVSEIPYFWQGKIENININTEYNELEYKTQRDWSIIRPLVCGLFHGEVKNNLILDRIKKTYNI